PPYCDPPPLHSFPTRRSSDLTPSSAAPDRAGNLYPPRPARDHRPRAGRFHRIGRVHQQEEANVFAPVSRFLAFCMRRGGRGGRLDRKSTRLNSSHVKISYAVL